jgi:hypothetical protein
MRDLKNSPNARSSRFAALDSSMKSSSLRSTVTRLVFFPDSRAMSVPEVKGVDSWKSAHQAALVGLAHLFPLHSVPRHVVTSNERRKESDNRDHHVLVSDAVDKQSGASSHESCIDQPIGAGHGSCLGVAQLGPDAGVGLLAKHLTRDLPFGINLGLECVGRVHVPAPGETLVEILNIDASKSGEALTVFGCEWLEHSPILAIRYKNCKRFAKYDELLSARTPNMETKGDRRRRKLIELVDTVDGGLPAIADRAECSVGSLQQLIDVTPLPTKKDGTWSRKQMGDVTAQRIEDAFNYPRGWFDTDAPAKAQPPVNALQEALALIASYGKTVVPLRRDDVARKLSELFLQPERFNEYADDILRWLNPPLRLQHIAFDTEATVKQTGLGQTPKGLVKDGNGSQVPAKGGKNR